MNKQTDLLQNLFHPAKLEIRQDHTIECCEGDIEYYSLPVSEISGRDITDFLPCLFGLEENLDTRLLYVNISDSVTADIHVYWHQQGYSVLLIDSSDRRSSHQEVQQVANELGLMYEKLEILSNKLKHQNQLLDEANQAKSLFISGISHEFRTPMISILGHLTWIGKDLPADSEQYRSIKSIDRSAHYLLSLIDNLLHQGKIEADTIAPTLQPVAMDAFFEHIIDSLKPMAKEKPLELLSHVQHVADQALLIDEYHLHQILLNLLTNAIKYTRQGRVSLSASYSNEELTVSVSDTGIGIPTAARRDLLKPFTRATNSYEIQGAGLGLSIVQGLLKAMNGRLDIESEVGKGTNVVITIPADRTEKTANTSPVPDYDLEAVNGPVFIIDDNPDILAVYSLFFDEASLTTQMFTEPADFLGATLDEHPPLVLMDYNLGNENGVEVATTLRSSGFQGRIIMLTATAAIDQKLYSQAVKAGCTQFIPKPMDVSELIKLTIQELKT